LLKDIIGVKTFDDQPDIKHNYSYFPVLITKEFKKSRDRVYEELHEQNIFSRRYFYPLISNFPAYRALPTAKKENLPVANRISEEVLCLPLYADLRNEDIRKIITIIKKVDNNGK
jgi:dTDP-4-amino-4,6-dideoxygalactose transaminase